MTTPAALPARSLTTLALSPTNQSLTLPLHQNPPTEYFLTGIFSDQTTENLSQTATWSSSDASVSLVPNPAGGGMFLKVTGTPPSQVTLTVTFMGRSTSTPVYFTNLQ